MWLNGKRIADRSTVAGAYRTYDFDVTDLLKGGASNVVAVKTFAPTEKDLGINWVDWNPCPPDKDMGLWGDGQPGRHRRSHSTLAACLSPTSAMSCSTRADLTIYAELHNASAHEVKGTLAGSAAGIQFEQPVEARRP